MIEPAPRILFVPVSGRYGMGEYARAAAIAHAAAGRWPRAEIHFMLSRAAPYAASVPFATTWLASSATFHTPEVCRRIEEWRPHLVVFDNAGRTAQLKAAREAGARIVYVSARSRQRRKAFRLRWMRMLDEHWIAYPEFLAGSLGWLERAKLKMLGRPAVRYLDVIFSRTPTARLEAIRAETGCEAGDYVLMVPGGGTGHPGADAATAQFRAAGQALAAQGVRTLFVGPEPGAAGAAGATQNGAPFHAVGALAQGDLAALLRGARLVVANGGSTLLQALACGAPTIAVAIAGDQAGRIGGCVSAGVARTAPLAAEAIGAAALALLRDEPARAALARRAADLKLVDGVQTALGAMERLIAAGSPGA